MADYCTNDDIILTNDITFSECQNAMKNDQFQKDFVLFYVNLVLIVLRTIFEFVRDYSVYIILAVVVYFLLFVIYRSYINPVLYKKVSML